MNLLFKELESTIETNHEQPKPAAPLPRTRGKTGGTKRKQPGDSGGDSTSGWDTDHREWKKHKISVDPHIDDSDSDSADDSRLSNELPMNKPPPLQEMGWNDRSAGQLHGKKVRTSVCIQCNAYP